jgi:hypothetical protein
MTMPSDAELLPCPFCGSKLILHPEKYDPPAHQPVECPTDECPMSHIWPDINTWNRRAQPSAEPTPENRRRFADIMERKARGFPPAPVPDTEPEPEDDPDGVARMNRATRRARPAPVPDDLIAEINRLLSGYHLEWPYADIITRARDQIAALETSYDELSDAHDDFRRDWHKAMNELAEYRMRIDKLEREAKELRAAQVPREPTQAMIARAFDSRPDLPLSQWLNNGIMRGLWTAMYDAARTVPQAGGRTG